MRCSRLRPAYAPLVPIVVASLEAASTSIMSCLFREFLDVGVEGRSRDSHQAASAVPKMRGNGRSEDVIFFDGVFFEPSLKSIFFVS